MELAAADGYDVLHASPSTQAFYVDTADKYPPDGLTKRTVDGAYDNPAIIIKD